ncbi:Carbohydrate esterase [subsurface metagenome]
MIKLKLITAFAACLFLFNLVSAQLHEGKYKGAIYKEADVPEYTLPDVLTSFDGEKIKSAKQWEKTRRPEIIEFFEQNIYGEEPTPTSPIQKSFEIISEDATVLEGLCTRRDVLITFENNIGKVTMPLVLFVPNNVSKPVPSILLANGSDIKSKGFQLNNPQRFGHTRNGVPLKQLMLRGIGLAAIDYIAFGQDNRDKEGKVSGGVAELFFEEGQEFTKENEWGMIAIWAYAVRAGMDYLETDKAINPKQVAPLGSSIGGKVALWAAIIDQRFGMTLLATAGHGGDAIWRREFGETLDNMCVWLPTWVCLNANKFAKNINDMPVDQHSLMATLAPRPFYASNAQHDLWADQKGQWIGTYNSTPSYKLYGKKVAFTSPEQPPVDEPIIESAIGYHVRSGFHGLDLYDWEQYMKFIEYHFMNISIRSAHDIYYPNGELLDHYPNKLQESQIVN